MRLTSAVSVSQLKDYLRLTATTTANVWLRASKFHEFDYIDR